MEHRHTAAAIFSAAIATVAFSAIGAGAGASTHHDLVTKGLKSSVTARKVDAGTPSASKRATLHAGTAIVKGKKETVLVDSAGLPVYFYKFDGVKRSLVTAGLARLWPPVLSTSPNQKGLTGTVSLLKDNFGEQVAYNGHLLYTFVGDSPGRVNGQGVSNFFVATPHLKTVSTSSKVAPPATSSASGYGY